MVGLVVAIQLSQESVKDIQIEYIDIEQLPMLNTDLESPGTFPPVVEAFRQKIKEADSVLFASPEYNFSIAGTLLSLISFSNIYCAVCFWKLECIYSIIALIKM